MANLFSMPSAVIGLMGSRGANPQTLWDLLNAQQQPEFDAGDEYFTNPSARPQGRGVPTLQDNGQVGFTPQAPAMQPVTTQPRQRVSVLNVLGRALAPNITGALDDERTRLQAEADKPQQQERINRVLSGITDPREAALFLGLGGKDWQSNVGQQFAPQVVGQGAVQSIIGDGRTVRNPMTREFGDSLVRDTPEGVQTLVTRGPTIQEQTAQQKLDWDRQYGTQNLAIAQQNANSTSQNANTTAENAGFTIGNGQQRRAPDGTLIAEGPTAPNAAATATAQAVAGFEANNDRFRNLLTAINGDPTRGIAPAFELSPLKAAQYKAALATGIGMSPEAAAYGNYQSEVDAAVADSLRLNTGPQTDQDAIREAKALLSNRDNKAYVNARLPTIIANNERLSRARQAGSSQSQAGQPPRVGSVAEAQALPPGTVFIDPNGVRRLRP